MRTGIALLVAAIVVARPAVAEEHVLDRCEDPHVLKTSKGDTVRIDCALAVVATPAWGAVRAGADAELAELRRAKEIADLLLRDMEKAIGTYRQIEAVQDASYDQLMGAYRDAAKAAHDANENTRGALALARKMRRASYLTAALMGAGAGAVTGWQLQDSGSATAMGAASGLVVGVLVNHVIVR